MQTSSTNKKIIVAGAGIAGLATAARLASKGFDVTVFERNSYPGGKLAFWEKDGYRFDKGPSLFIQPGIHKELYDYCGRDMKNYLPYIPLDIITHYFFEDGTRINFYTDPNKTAEEISRVLPIDKQVVLDYLQNADKLYQKIGRIFLDEPIHDIKTWFSPRIPAALKTLKWNYLLQTMHQYNVQKLKHPKLVQLFDRYATYNGSNPYSTPSMLTMIPHFEITEGTYYPLGGMVSIPQGVYTLCRDLGVKFHFNTAVEKIIIKDHKACGVVAGGKEVYADAVVSNSDVYFTYKHLLGDEVKAAQIQKQERSTGGYIFYWGMNKSFPQLHLHNIFFAGDYKKEFDAIFKKQDIYEDPTIYINITSKVEAENAPDGCENWFVFINAPAGNIERSEETAVRAKKYIIEKLNRILGEDIEQHITVEDKLTPELIEKLTGGYMGSLYGTSSNSSMAAFKRHSNESAKYKGLYFASGTVHPGGGIPLCLRSAKIAAELIVNSR